MEVKYIETERKTGKEAFTFYNQPIGVTLSEFWPWAHSDLAINIERGKLAEFIIATALGITDTISSAWDSFDLSYMGRGVEVKSAAYLQSWYQDEESPISFGMQVTKAWNASTGKYELERKRQSDIYVFCLLKHKDKLTLDPLNLNQWDFYIVPTKLFNELVPTQKTISMAFFKRNKISPCGYSEIQTRIEDIFKNL